MVESKELYQEKKNARKYQRELPLVVEKISENFLKSNTTKEVKSIASKLVFDGYKINITNQNGYCHILFSKKDHLNEAHKIDIVIGVSGEQNFKVYPQNHKEDYYYQATKVADVNLESELKQFLSFLDKGGNLENSKFKKIEYPKMDDFDGSDYVEDFSQKKFDKIVVEDGHKAANIWAQSLVKK